jgi:hypothetical protein
MEPQTYKRLEQKTLDPLKDINLISNNRIFHLRNNNTSNVSKNAKHLLKFKTLSCNFISQVQ